MAPPRRKEADTKRVCIRPECEYYGKTGSMIETGRSGKNSCFQCRKCRKGYSATYGTIFYQKKTKPAEIMRVLKALVEGNSIRGASRIFGHDKDAIISWLKQAGEHCKKFEEVMVKEFNFSQIQVDELWTFIQKKTTHEVVRDEKKTKPLA